MSSDSRLTSKLLVPPHFFPRIRIVFLLGLLLAMAACSQTSLTSSTPTPTPTSTTARTPTLAPAQCDAQFGSAYVMTLPDSTYPETTVYAQVPLPPQTRSHDDDASGLRGRFMCSAGTTDSVTTFMTQQLTELGWQPVAAVTDCGRAVIPIFAHQQCWKNGKYLLYVGITSNADWAIAYIDPAFLQ